MIRIEPKETPLKERHQMLLGSVAPRPIAFASTLDSDGTPNLSPFSFFNLFGSNPPIIVFSPSRRGRDNTTKDTYENIKATGEAVINIVTYDIVQQMILASSEYPSSYDEFEKAGFTKVPSEMVKPFRVKESPVHLEVKLRDLINYAEVGGGGNLAICEVVLMHIDEKVIGEDGFPDPHKMDHVGRLGRSWYTRAKEGLFIAKAPKGKDNIGLDKMPDKIKHSKILSGNDLGKLGMQNEFPTDEDISQVRNSPQISELLKSNISAGDKESELHKIAKVLISEDKIEEAWRVLLSFSD